MATIRECYDEDSTLSWLLDDIEQRKLTGVLPPDTTEDELMSINDEITRRIETNAAAILALISLDDDPDAATVDISFFAKLGGESVRVKVEVRNLGYIDALPTIERRCRPWAKS